MKISNGILTTACLVIFGTGSPALMEVILERKLEGNVYYVSRSLD